jgi:hypothetical protein
VNNGDLGLLVPDAIVVGGSAVCDIPARNRRRFWVGFREERTGAERGAQGLYREGFKEGVALQEGVGAPRHHRR